jgi:hypothetical protein
VRAAAGDRDGTTTSYAAGEVIDGAKVLRPRRNLDIAGKPRARRGLALTGWSWHCRGVPAR